MPKEFKYSQPVIVPNASEHVEEAHNRRNALNADSAAAVHTQHNGEAEAFAGTWPTNFSKGLDHDENGIVNASDYTAFFEEIADPTYTENANERTASFEVPKFSGSYRTKSKIDKSEFEWRAWESPLAGHQFVLQGPDVGAVGMAPAPRLGSDELAAEMAEVYAMAHLRDMSFEDIRKGTGDAEGVVKALGQMTWFRTDGNPKDANGGPISKVSENRRNRDGDALTSQTLFRGSAAGCAAGPYLSQFMLQGHNQRANGKTQLESTQPVPGRAMMANGDPVKAKDGKILYGAQRIDQRVEPQKANVDYMRDWAEWLDVQNGANTKNEQAFQNEGLKFIETPRDLATYVHFDALYQAYLNACLLMLSWKTEADAGLPEPNANGKRDSFATWGGPHILTLVTETATRALRAVRRQKFQMHNRARPEKLGSVASLSANGHGAALGAAETLAATHLEKLETAAYGGFDLMGAVATAPAHKRFEHGAGSQEGLPANDRNLLLPMAFPEGSPMHPAYGAGHATVAGACVTVLKAFFRTHSEDGKPVSLATAGAPAVYVPAAGGKSLVEGAGADDSVDQLTLNGELNKLSANISIGRNMAGVHFYSDYFDSARMGERIAVGILVEQMSTYTESVTMSLETFDGDRLVIAGDGKGGSEVHIEGGSMKEWWTRHLPEQLEA